MEVEYERSLNHNYMIFKNMEDFCEDYQIHMLMEQNIPNVLKVDLRYMNGKPELYYDISAKQKLSEWLKIKKITYDVLEGILRSLKNAFEAGMDYLLECNCFMLDVRYMFIDVENYELSLCYYPLNDKDITESGQEFLQYILEMLDYNDKIAVEEAYEIFRLCMRDGFSIKLLNKFVETGEEKKLTEAEIAKAATVAEAAVIAAIAHEDKSRTSALLKDWVQVVKPKVADEEVWEEQEEFGFVPLNLRLRRCCVAGLVVAELFILVIVSWLFKKSVAAWLLCAVGTLLIGMAILVLTVFYERIMQFTRIISVKKNISYNGEAEYVDIPEAGKEYIMPEKEPAAKEAVNSMSDVQYELEETMLLGFAAGNVGLKRLHYIGEGTQEDIVIIKNPFTVGKSSKDTDYKLDYPFVSRMHFRIDEKAGEYYITDTNSKNGIMLNREYLNANETSRLMEGDRIEIGNLVFLFQ